ncbi:hypothetical protein BV394_07990 [Brevirhabdus pacifica]|uniref:Uncharacterized protein n=1 Tax=Brevirhabdus pacifica TaxID=1267768 RepID=A0A1U7DIF3_9RHOB|nr:hypothetical protein [Brevirhabdus pacifica]APX89663.1 hypothetical protein BV394_07990 [Brevirhabdus pacifica]OWU74510.1 hypothetical protein ATO5_12640 [Loktanella sp. 22II-4b]PJJ85658.1 hypothetical protein CLV77_0178 [Brevirhabdus pacifica]
MTMNIHGGHAATPPHARPISNRLRRAPLERKGRPSLAIPLAVSFIAVAGLIALYFAIFDAPHVENAEATSAAVVTEEAGATGGQAAGSTEGDAAARDGAAGTDPAAAGQADTGADKANANTAQENAATAAEVAPEGAAAPTTQEETPGAPTAQ